MKQALLILSFLIFVVQLWSLPELSGIIISSEGPRFVLVEPDTGESSRWIRIGDEFRGYRLVEFRTETDTMVLSRDGSTYEISLKKSRIVDRGGPESGRELPRIVFSGGGQVIIGETRVAIANLGSWLAQHAASDAPVELAISDRADYAEAMTILDTVREAGFRRIRFTTDK